MSRAPNVTRTVLERYEEGLLGLPVVLVNAVVREEDEETGEATYEIPDMDGLVAAVAVTRALLPVKLSPKDIRTMRKAMELTGRELAEKMDTTPETVSRWENNGLAMGGYTEKVFRQLVCSVLGRRAPAILWDPLDIIGMKIVPMPDGDARLPPLVFEQVKVVIPQDGTKAPAWDEVSREAA